MSAVDRAPGRPAARPSAGGRRAPRCRTGGCRAGRSRRTRRCTAWGRCRSAGKGRSERTVRAVDDHHLAGLELADEVWRRRRRAPASPRPGPSPPTRRWPEPAEAQGPEAVRVADADQPVGVEEHEGERALERGQHRDRGPARGRRRLGRVSSGTSGGMARASSSATRSLSRGDHPGQHPGRCGQRRRCWSGCRCGRGRSRPGRRPGTPAGRCASRSSPVVEYRVWPMARWPRRPASLRSLNTVVTRPMSFIDRDGVAVADRHAGRLLAPVLEGVEPVEGEVGDRPPRGVDPEDPARFLGLHHRLVTARTGGRRADRRPRSRPHNCHVVPVQPSGGAGSARRSARPGRSHRSR